MDRSIVGQHSAMHYYGGAVAVRTALLELQSTLIRSHIATNVLLLRPLSLICTTINLRYSQKKIRLLRLY